MPKVYNKRDKYVPQDAVYIGRPTPWGNPFTHINKYKTLAEIVVPSREISVQAYELLVTGRLEHIPAMIQRLPDTPRALDGGQWGHLVSISTHIRTHLKTLRGQDLVCWCAPLACHGDILLAHANKEDE